jgi:hypothetical protein
MTALNPAIETFEDSTVVENITIATIVEPTLSLINDTVTVSRTDYENLTGSNSEAIAKAYLEGANSFGQVELPEDSDEWTVEQTIQYHRDFYAAKAANYYAGIKDDRLKTEIHESLETIKEESFNAGKYSILNDITGDISNNPALKDLYDEAFNAGYAKHQSEVSESEIQTKTSSDLFVDVDPMKLFSQEMNTYFSVEHLQKGSVNTPSTVQDLLILQLCNAMTDSVNRSLKDKNQVLQNILMGFIILYQKHTGKNTLQGVGNIATMNLNSLNNTDLSIAAAHLGTLLSNVVAENSLLKNTLETERANHLKVSVSKSSHSDDRRIQSLEDEVTKKQAEIKRLSNELLSRPDSVVEDSVEVSAILGDAEAGVYLRINKETNDIGTTRKFKFATQFSDEAEAARYLETLSAKKLKGKINKDLTILPQVVALKEVVVSRPVITKEDESVRYPRVSDALRQTITKYRAFKLPK